MATAAFAGPSPSGQEDFRPMLELPKRIPLAAQAAATLRKAIAGGAWKEYLPSERRLSMVLRVSRPTVRAALKQLAQEGLIATQHRKRNRIVPGLPLTVSSPSRLVLLVTPEPLARISLTAYHALGEMRTQLAEHGFTTEIFVCRRSSVDAQRRALERFMRHTRVFFSVLLSVRKEVQQWFSDRALPCLVIGSCHPKVKLPSLDTDYRSVCRHAAGVFLARGHTRLAFLVPNLGNVGDLRSEEGFLEAVSKWRQPRQVSAVIARHSGTAQCLNARLDGLFLSLEPPTALLVARPQFAFFVMTYLLKRGLAVPGAVSLISRDHDCLFDSLLSHYTLGEFTYAHHLSRLMLRMVNQHYLAPEPHLIFPKYAEGGTVLNLNR